jgi:signal transduction histidine kinase/HAMP domain-containing protein
MRFSIRAKQVAGVTALVGAVVIVLSAVHLTRVAQVGLHESEARGELLAKAILHRIRQIVTDSADPYRAVESDSGLQSLLQSSIYGESVTDAAIVDAKGAIIAHSDPARVGTRLDSRDDLTALLGATAWNQLRVIYSSDGATLEVRQPMMLDDQDFGSVRIGVSTVLLRHELNEAIRPALITAASALAIAVFFAGFLTRLVLRPIHVIRSGLTRLGKGEFGVTLDLPPGDEFGELGNSFNAVSRQLSADRSELAGQKAHLQSAVEHLEDAVALFNPSAELLFTNPAMESVLPRSVIGRSVGSVLQVAHPYRRIVEETLATRQSRGPVQTSIEPRSPNTETRTDLEQRTQHRDIRTRDDADRLLLTHAIAGVDGQLMGVLLVSRNLSYLSQMQSTLAYSRKLVALGRLTAGIAHEVKNPLNAMMIHLELLRTKIRSGTLARVRMPEPVAAGSLGLADPRPSEAEASALQHVQVIEGEVRRLDEVVQGFLKFTRPEDLRLQPVRMSAVFDEIVPLVQADADRQHVVIETSCPLSTRSVNGDAAMLRQAILNLAINACQAMPNGGVLRLTAADAARGRVEVRVSDTGLGIAPEHLSRIFDLYFTTKDHGTGIGLSMVYRIVQMHDGDIEVESTSGRGTTFRLLLPSGHER